MSGNTPAELIEQHSEFAVMMFRATLVGLEMNKNLGWTREASDQAERVFIDALADNRAALTGEQG